MLENDPKDRISAKHILEHPWLKSQLKGEGSLRMPVLTCGRPARGVRPVRQGPEKSKRRRGDEAKDERGEPSKRQKSNGGV